MMLRPIHFVFAIAAALVALMAGRVLAEEENQKLETLKVGDVAKDYQWQTLGEEDEKVKLSELAKKGPVVLVVLRGYPGYQCPICSRQVADLAKHAKDFERLGASVVLVYPGPAQELKQRAKEFLGDRLLPEPLVLVVDPDYAFTNLYRLRWDAPRETSYPSTFVLDENRRVKFRKVSHSHGDRAKTEDVLEVLEEMQSAETPAGGGE